MKWDHGGILFLREFERVEGIAARWTRVSACVRVESKSRRRMNMEFEFEFEGGWGGGMVWYGGWVGE